MKLAAQILLLVSIAATLAAAQNVPNTPFQHVIVVIQENRTPDNLFGSDAFASQPQLPGADLVQEGQCYNIAPYTVPLQSINLGNMCNPDHSHKPGWINTYNSGAMDGACKNSTGNTCGSMSYPQYTYVQSSDVVPYFQIAQQYGYANYMFQTSQGPSFPAHQFLLSGTSAPILDDNDNNQYWQWFAAENGPKGALYGCTGVNTVIAELKPGDTKDEYPGYMGGYPCYNHNTLVDVLEHPQGGVQKISWKYYSHATSLNGPPDTSLWTAPNANFEICGPNSGDTACVGNDWTDYVKSVFPNSQYYVNSFSPILTDLGADPNQPQCALPGVSWVVPRREVVRPRPGGHGQRRAFLGVGDH